MANNIKFPSNNSPYTHIYEYYSNVKEDELKRIAGLKQLKFLKELQEKFEQPDLQRHIAKTIQKCIVEYLGIENSPKKNKKTNTIKEVKDVKELPEKDKIEDKKTVDKSEEKDKLEYIETVDKSEEKKFIFLDEKSAEKVNQLDRELEELKSENKLLREQVEDLNVKINKYEKINKPSNEVNKSALIKDVYSSICMSNGETLNITVNRLYFTDVINCLSEEEPEILLTASRNLVNINTAVANIILSLFLKERGYKQR